MLSLSYTATCHMNTWWIHTSMWADVTSQFASLDWCVATLRTTIWFLIRMSVTHVPNQLARSRKRCITFLTHTHIHNHFMAVCLGLPGWAGTRRNTHPLRPIPIINHPLPASSIYYDPQHPPCSIYVLDSLFAQPLSKSSLVYLLVWHSLLYTPYIFSSNHSLIIATYAHTRRYISPSSGFSGAKWR